MQDSEPSWMWVPIHLNWPVSLWIISVIFVIESSCYSKFSHFFIIIFLAAKKNAVGEVERCFAEAGELVSEVGWSRWFKSVRKADAALTIFKSILISTRRHFRFRLTIRRFHIGKESMFNFTRTVASTYKICLQLKVATIAKYRSL